MITFTWVDPDEDLTSLSSCSKCGAVVHGAAGEDLHREYHEKNDREDAK